MGYVAWAGISLVLSVGLLVFWLITALQENCATGRDRVLCGSFLQDTLLPVLPYAFMVASTTTAVLFAMAIGDLLRHRAQRGEGEQEQ